MSTWQKHTKNRAKGKKKGKQTALNKDTAVAAMINNNEVLMPVPGLGQEERDGEKGNPEEPQSGQPPSLWR